MTNILILSFTLLTNRPAIDFSAAGSYAVWHASNRCYSASITFTGAPGLYDVQWSASASGGFLTMWPTFTNSTGTLTTNIPIRDVDREAYIRIKKR